MNEALPILARPVESASKSGRAELPDLEESLEELKQVGLLGLEVYYGDHTPEQVTRIEQIADRLELVKCGGSDYHATGDPDEPEPGSVEPPPETIDTLTPLNNHSGNLR